MTVVLLMPTTRPRSKQDDVFFSKDSILMMPRVPRNASKTHDQEPLRETSSDASPGMAEILKELWAFRTETSGNFEILRKEISDLKTEIADVKERMDIAEQRLSENEDNERNTTRVMIHMLQVQNQLKEKCEDLESRSRRNNLRIYSVPEKIEGNNMIKFVTNLFVEQLELDAELQIERAHRRPRSIMVQFRSYVTKQTVLKAAWTKRNIQVSGSRIFFDEDFTPAVYKERGKYKEVRKTLRERKIKHHILFPAKLKIFLEDGKVKVFDNPVAAAHGLRDFGIKMKSPAEEPNLETILRAAGWHSSRKMTPTTKMIDAVKSLLQSKEPDNDH
uniref:L1 transposable element RRM domain-containing protein n=1 Tax=Neogobius melanostomus TaxID=47308 RepID=A0A8C6SYG1_9GOBI